MPLETATYLYDLVPANPPGTDGVRQGDDHLRMIKAVLQNTFTNVTGPEVPFATGIPAAQQVQYSYAPLSYSNGQTITFISANPSVGPSTISVNNGPPIPVHFAGGPLTGGELTPGHMYTLMYYNGAFNIMASDLGAVGRYVNTFNGRTGDVTLASGDITSAGGALLASPNFTGTPSAPTPPQSSADGTLATTLFVGNQINSSRATSVISFNNRFQAVTLTLADVEGAGGAPINSPAFTGNIDLTGGSAFTRTPLPGDSSTYVANTAFVQNALGLYLPLTGGTLTGALTVQGSSTFYNPVTIDSQTANSAILTLVKRSNANAAMIVGYRSNIGRWVLYLGTSDPESSGNAGTNFQLSRFSDTGTLLDNPITIARATGIVVFSQIPTAPTAMLGDNSTNLATTAYVLAAIANSPAAVVSFNGRTGTVTLTLADVTGVGGAPLASPTFTGTPAAPTPALTDNSTHLATTAYIKSALANMRWNGSFP